MISAKSRWFLGRW